MNTGVKEEAKTVTFRGEYRCNAEWTADPYEVEIYLKPDWKERIERMVKALYDTGGDVMTTWWAGNYEFFDEDGKIFDPDYSIDGCSLKVFKSGTFRFAFPFKHSSEEGWTDAFRWEDGEAA